MAKKRVLVLFKTHLDVGFTDLAGSITERYLSVYKTTLRRRVSPPPKL